MGDGKVIYPVSIPNVDGNGRPDPVGLIRDVLTDASHHNPDVDLFPPINLRSGSWLSRATPLGRSSAVRLADRALFAPWADTLHAVEQRLQGMTPEERVAVERFILDRFMFKTGVSASLAHANSDRADAVDVFKPQSLTMADLVSGIHIKEGSPFRLSGGEFNTRLGALFEAEARGEIEFTGILRTLLNVYRVPDDQLDKITSVGLLTIHTYPSAPQWKERWKWMELRDVLKDIHHIKIEEFDVNNPQGGGYEPHVTLLNGVTVRGETGLHMIRDMQDEGLVNEHFEKQAELVHGAAEAAGGRLVFATKGADGGPARNVFLVGTGLTGEIASGVVEAFFEGGAHIYMPGTSETSSRLSAALVVKQIAVDVGRLRKVPDDYAEVVIRGGRLLVGKTDALDPGRFVATVSALVPEGHKALYAGLAYSPRGKGTELLLEVSQHGIAGRLRRDDKIDGVIRLLSPTRVGKGERNDAAYFQGPSYQAAQLAKVWSTNVLTDINSARKEIPVSAPTGFITETDGLSHPIVDRTLPFAESSGVAVARTPRTTGSFLALDSIAAHLVFEVPGFGIPAVPRQSKPEATDALGSVFDGGVENLRHPLNRTIAGAFARSLVQKPPQQTLPGSRLPNVRVNGPVIEVLERRRGQFKDISKIPDQVLAHAKNPQEGFDPFTFKLEDGTTNYVLWIKDPSEFPGVIGDQMKHFWYNSLGVVMIVNPERDFYALIHHHGIRETPWSIYKRPTGADYQTQAMARIMAQTTTATGGDSAPDSLFDLPPPGDGRLPRHNLGGAMAYSNARAETADLAVLLGAWGVIKAGEAVPDNFDPTQLSADQQAALMFMGAASMVAGKAYAMTIKYVLISEALERIGLPSAGLGGGKTIIMTSSDDATKHLALRAVGVAAQKTGAYISGPDQNVGQVRPRKEKVKVNGVEKEIDIWPMVDGEEIHNWPDVMAEVAPFHMAGSPKAHPLVRGLGEETSLATARGGYQGMKVYMDEIKMKPDGGIFFVGYGQAGTPFAKLAAKDGRNIAAIADIDLGALFKARLELEGDPLFPDRAPPGVYKGKREIYYVWDRKEAKSALPPHEYEKQLSAAYDHQEQGSNRLIIADGLDDGIRQVRERSRQEIDILSPNGSLHAVTEQVLRALKEAGGHAVIGIANNMLSLDEKGDYLKVANLAVKLGIFIPHDSAINMMGAASVIFRAVGIIREDGTLDEDKMEKLIKIVGERVFGEHKKAFLKGIAPQWYRDQFAKRKWNALVDSGVATAGKFELEEPTATPPDRSGPGGGNGNGGPKGYGDVATGPEVWSIRHQAPPPIKLVGSRDVRPSVRLVSSSPETAEEGEVSDAVERGGGRKKKGDRARARGLPVVGGALTVRPAAMPMVVAP